MKKGRLHAYEVLHRVAQVREMRASQALAGARSVERAQREECRVVETARDQVTAASRSQVTDSTRLDMARYEMLARLDALLAARQHQAMQDLTAAETASKERAGLSVLAKRYREQVEEHVDELHRSLDQTSSAASQEEDIELWLGSKDR